MLITNTKEDGSAQCNKICIGSSSHRAQLCQTRNEKPREPKLDTLSNCGKFNRTGNRLSPKRTVPTFLLANLMSPGCGTVDDGASIGR